jgi:hypothetical protein
MNRKSLVASLGLVAGLTAVLSAQARSSNGTVDQQAVQSIRVKVIGCVAHGATAGRYALTRAFLSGDDIPQAVGTAGKRGSGKDLSFENSLSYELIGGRLKAQLGHEVEIVGITSDARLNHSGARSAAIGSSTHEKTTLMVESVKILAPTCR